jgi:hypothetical protein
MLAAALVASCLIVPAAMPVSAQTGYKPSTPQFSVKLIDNSIDVPPYNTTTINQYTGEETTIFHPGYRGKDMIVEVTIKSQPFTSYKDADGYEHNRHYDVQFKGHFGDEQNWRGIGSGLTCDSQYIVLSGNGMTGNMSGLYINHYAAGTQLDFRVREFVAYYGPFLYDDDSMGLYTPREFIIEKSSDYSSIQTITIPGGTSSSPPSQTTTTWPPVASEGNSQPQFPDQTQPPNSIFSDPFVIFGVGVLFAGIVITVVLVLRKQLKTSTIGAEGLYA